MPLMNITKEIGDMAQGPKNNNLLKRIISALVMLPIAIFIILSGGVPFFILISLLTILVLSEWNGICENKPISLLFGVQALCGVLLMYQIYWGSPYIEISIASSLVSIIAVSYIVKAKVRWALMGFLYAVIPSISFFLIHQQSGGLVVLWMMIVIWSMDTGAYFAGKNIGGPKMAPKISPNKTWSGLIGGTLTAMALGWVYVFFVKDNNIPLFDNVTILLFLSGFFAILSQIGDLAESAVKRHFSIKDSGSLIPGHGGIMDRIDGVLFVAPALVLTEYLMFAR
jgi:phosphatidate cytidylyltransferase